MLKTLSQLGLPLRQLFGVDAMVRRLAVDGCNPVARLRVGTGALWQTARHACAQALS